MQSRRLVIGYMLVALGVASLGVGGVTAQEAEEPTPPEGWVVRTDRGGHGAGGGLEFNDMPPGWHITTGPAAIFYHPEKTSSGNYRVETEVFLFDPGRRNEAFGLFIGGSDLDGENQAYTYFLIRNSGSFLVKRRDGDGTSTLQNWTDHPAIVTWDTRGEGKATAGNVLAIEAGAEELAFFVNGREVHRMPREGQHTEGVVGLRVNHALNLHFSRLDVMPSG